MGPQLPKFSGAARLGGEGLCRGSGALTAPRRGLPLRPWCGGLGEVCPPAHAVQPCSAALPPALTAAPRPVRVGGLCSHTERHSCVV